MNSVSHIPTCVFSNFFDYDQLEQEEIMDENEGRIDCTCNASQEPEEQPHETIFVHSDLFQLLAQDPETAAPILREQGYSATKFISEEKLKTLLGENNLLEVIKCIWALQDISTQILELRKLADQNYPLFILELSRFLTIEHIGKRYRTERAKKLALRNIWQHSIKGRMLARLDVACLTSETTRNAMNSFTKEIYDMNPPGFSMGDKKRIIDHMLAFLREIDVRKLPGPPCWVQKRTEVRIFAPKLKWPELREQERQRLIDPKNRFYAKISS